MNPENLGTGQPFFPPPNPEKKPGFGRKESGKKPPRSRTTDGKLLRRLAPLVGALVLVPGDTSTREASSPTRPEARETAPPIVRSISARERPRMPTRHRSEEKSMSEKDMDRLKALGMGIAAKISADYLRRKPTTEELTRTLWREMEKACSEFEGTAIKRTNDCALVVIMTAKNQLSRYTWSIAKDYPDEAYTMTQATHYDPDVYRDEMRPEDEFRQCNGADIGVLSSRGDIAMDFLQKQIDDPSIGMKLALENNLSDIPELLNLVEKSDQQLIKDSLKELVALYESQLAYMDNIEDGEYDEENYQKYSKLLAEARHVVQQLGLN